MTTLNIDNATTHSKQHFPKATSQWLPENEFTESERLSERREHRNDELNLILNRKKRVVVALKYLLVGLSIAWFAWA
ncbi:hypothetical protein [Aliivibrio kagoshimensis]|uniref:hypothetical protein n=1 Tax=Aliivibrio kagoshimensis TaxID=2910230 RepID=UPI003D0AABFE